MAEATELGRVLDDHGLDRTIGMLDRPQQLMDPRILLRVLTGTRSVTA